MIVHHRMKNTMLRINSQGSPGLAVISVRAKAVLLTGLMLIGQVLTSQIFIGETQAADQLVRISDNATLRGEFKSMTPEAITIALTNGKTETVSVADIALVRFDQEPLQLSQARSNERTALDAAIQKYKTIQGEYTGGDKRLVTDLQFLIARAEVKLAMADPARRESAMTAIKTFRAAEKANFRYLEATLLEAMLAAESGQPDAAKALLEEVKSSPVPGFQLQAGVQLGRLLLTAGNAEQALQAFDQVVQESTDDTMKSAHFDGLLGRALCLQKQDKLPEALAVIEEVLNKAAENDTRVLAEAYLHKGDCLRQQNQPKAALMSYLHVDVLYSSEPAEHAQALFHLAELWGPAGHQDRADDAASRLREKYPNSPWAKQLKGG